MDDILYTKSRITLSSYHAIIRSRYLRYNQATVLRYHTITLNSTTTYVCVMLVHNVYRYGWFFSVQDVKRLRNCTRLGHLS